MSLLRKCKCGLEARSEDDLVLFYPDKASKYGRRNTCISCRNAYHSTYDNGNRKARAEKALKHYRRNKPEKDYERWVYNLQYTYGVSEDQYYSIKESQNHSCAICGTHQDELNKRLAVDHCHTTGKVRGLLCTLCNTGLGKFKDSVDTLSAAIKYLEEIK